MDTAKVQFKTIDEYIDSFPKEVGDKLQTLRETIKAVVPEAKETIKYNMPTFIFHGNLVYFSAYKKHIGFYPYTAEMAAAIQELAPYKAGKGTIQLPLAEVLPLPLIRKIVEFRVQENLARKAQKK